MSPDQIRELSAAMDEARDKALGPKPKPVRTESDMNATTILTRLKQHPGVLDQSKMGVVSSFGKGAEVRVKSDDRTRDLVVIANTDDIDLDNEVVVPSGANTSYFERNKQIFADHQYDLGNVVGTLRNLYRYPNETDHKAWRVVMHLHDNALGKAAQTIVEKTGQIGVSIGFVAKKFGPPDDEERKAYRSKDGTSPRSIVREWDWFELSVTALPCNVACQSLAVTQGKSADMLNEVERLVTKGQIDRESAYLLGMPIEPKRKVFAVSEPNPRRSVLQVYPWGSVG